MKVQSETLKPTRRLVGANQLLVELFDETERPSLRWLRYQQQRRVIPYIKVGRLCFFDIDDVRRYLAANFTVQAKPVSGTKSN